MSTDAVSGTSVSISIRGTTGTGSPGLLSSAMAHQQWSHEGHHQIQCLPNQRTWWNLTQLSVRAASFVLRGGPGFVASRTRAARNPHRLQHQALRLLAIDWHPSEWNRQRRSDSTSCLNGPRLAPNREKRMSTSWFSSGGLHRIRKWLLSAWRLANWALNQEITSAGTSSSIS